MTSNQEFLAAAATFSVTDAMTKERGDALGVKRSRNMTQSTYYTRVLKAVEADHAQYLVVMARQAEQAAETAARDARAAARADRDAWEAVVRADATHPEQRLLYALHRADSHVESYTRELAEFQTRLAQDPLYALSWSTHIVEAAASLKVAQWTLSAFEVGATVEQMTEEAMREMVSGAKNGSSRSTSTMSNLTDDCMTRAWAGVFERLSGRW